MLDSYLNDAPCICFGFADDGQLELLNASLYQRLGYETGSLEEKNIEQILTLPSRIFFQTHFFPLIRMQGHAGEIFMTLLSSSGEHIAVLLNAKRMSHDHKDLTTCICIEVPNRKKFEDELVAARKAAEKALAENTALTEAKSRLQSYAEKLENQISLVNRQNHELQQFYHVVTHNLKEPLRKMLMFSGKLQTEYDSPVFQKLVRSTEQMRAVVMGLQQYIWLNEKSNQFKKTDLNKIAMKAAEEAGNGLPPGSMELHVGVLPEIEGDEEQLQLLFYHLFSNAIKFKKAGKAIIRVDATIIKQNIFRAVENKYQYDDYLRLEVMDEGLGFDPVYREHVFELFRKLHYTEGQGIGLALCRKIVDNHSGQISAESEVNLFTKITAWLPLNRSSVKELQDILPDTTKKLS